MNVSPKADNSLPGALILVVEHEWSQRELACLSLSKAGYETHACADGASALRDFEALQPDLILVDVIMPDMDGIELCRQVRARSDGKNVPIVMVSSLENSDWIEKAYDCGATDFVLTPVNWTILSHRIRHILKSITAQAEIDATRARLLDAIESFPAEFRLFDAEDRLIQINGRAIENAPLIAEHIQKGSRFEDIMRDALAKGVIKNAIGREEAWIEERLAARRQQSDTHIMQRKDGRWVQVIERATADGGRLAIGTDITELKEREIALETARAKAEAAEAGSVAAHSRLIDAIESFPADFRLFDAEDRLLLTNGRAVENSSQIAKYLQQGNRFEEILRAAVANGVFKIAAGQEEMWIRERMAARRQPTATYILERGDGRWIQVIERVTADGGRLAIGTDITEMKERELALEKAKAKAEAADRAKSAFLANMSHELRTPLNAIIGFGQFLYSEPLGPLGVDTYKEYAGDIVESGDHLLSLINDILDMSRIEAGRMELQETEVHLSSTVDVCLRLVEDRAAQAGVTLENAIQDRSLILRADARIVKQMLLNLISNAVKFTDKDGYVRLSTDCRADGSLAVSVTDTGIGVKPEEIDKILTAFGQADGSRARQYEGTGLGLPLTKAMIELHGGKLEFNSEPGQGSMVSLVVPAERLRGEPGSFQQAADVA